MGRPSWQGRRWRSAVNSAYAMDSAIGERDSGPSLVSPLPLLVNIDAPLAPTAKLKKKQRALVLKSNTRSEHQLQIECTAMLHRVILPRPQVRWWAIDGAGSMDQTIGRHGVPIGLLEARNRKLRGLTKGVPDYQFFGWRTAYFIELKKDAEAKLTDDQEEVIGDLLAGGYDCAICWDLWQVFDRVNLWGLTRPCAVMA